MIFCLTVEINILLCGRSSFVFIKKEFCYKNVIFVLKKKHFFDQKGSHSLVSHQRIYLCFCDHVKNRFYFAFVINKPNMIIITWGPRHTCVLHPRFINHLPTYHNKSCCMNFHINLFNIVLYTRTCAWNCPRKSDRTVYHIKSIAAVLIQIYTVSIV